MISAGIVWIATALLITANAQAISLVPQSGDDRIEFTQAQLDRIERSCHMKVEHRTGPQPFVAPYCRCYVQSLVKYVPRAEWTRMIAWEAESSRLPQDTSRAQTVFLSDIAPTVVEVVRSCRATTAGVPHRAAEP